MRVDTLDVHFADVQFVYKGIKKLKFLNENKMKDHYCNNFVQS